MSDNYVPRTREYQLGHTAGGGREVGFVEAVKLGFAKYARFSGRAQRAEYRWFFLFTIIGGLVTGVIDGILFGWDVDDTEVFSSLFSLAVLVPSLALGWRRMHDIGKSGWWSLLPYAVIVFAIIAGVTVAVSGSGGGIAVVMGALIVAALVSGIYVLVLLVRDSDPHTNEYGPSPKYSSQVDVFS